MNSISNLFKSIRSINESLNSRALSIAHTSVFNNLSTAVKHKFT